MTPAQFVDQLNHNADDDRNGASNCHQPVRGASDTTISTARAQAVRQLAEKVALTANESCRAFADGIFWLPASQSQ